MAIQEKDLRVISDNNRAKMLEGIKDPGLKEVLEKVEKMDQNVSFKSEVFEGREVMRTLWLPSYLNNLVFKGNKYDLLKKVKDHILKHNIIEAYKNHKKNLSYFDKDMYMAYAAIGYEVIMWGLYRDLDDAVLLAKRYLGESPLSNLIHEPREKQLQATRAKGSNNHVVPREKKPSQNGKQVLKKPVEVTETEIKIIGIPELEDEKKEEFRSYDKDKLLSMLPLIKKEKVDDFSPQRAKIDPYFDQVVMFIVEVDFAIRAGRAIAFVQFDSHTGAELHAGIEKKCIPYLEKYREENKEQNGGVVVHNLTELYEKMVNAAKIHSAGLARQKKY